MTIITDTDTDTDVIDFDLANHPLNEYLTRNRLYISATHGNLASVQKILEIDGIKNPEFIRDAIKAAKDRMRIFYDRYHSREYKDVITALGKVTEILEMGGINEESAREAIKIAKDGMRIFYDRYHSHQYEEVITALESYLGTLYIDIACKHNQST